MRIVNPKSAFTLIEMIIIVAVIGILSTIAIPNFVKSRDIAKKNACIENMVRIRNADDMWALETNAQTGDTPLKSDIVSGYIRIWPRCGSSEYVIPAVGSNPTCPNSTEGHTLSGSETTGDDEAPPVPSPFF